MKDRRFEIATMIILLTFCVIVIGCYFIYDIVISNQSYTLFLKPFRVLECKKWNCKDVSSNISKYNDIEYNVVIDGVEYGVNNLYYNNVNNKYYVFNRNNDNLYESGDLYGYFGKVNINSLKYQIDEINSNDYNNIKEKLNLDFNENYVTEDGKISLDYDNDGKLESLYYFYTGLDVGSLDMYFEYVIYEDNFKFYIIIGNSTLKDNFDDVGESKVSNILDIFGDGNIEFILSSRYGSTGKSCDTLYRLKGKKFVSVNECETLRK